MTKEDNVGEYRIGFARGGYKLFPTSSNPRCIMHL